MFLKMKEEYMLLYGTANFIYYIISTTTGHTMLS